MNTLTFTVASGADDSSVWREGSAWPPTGAYHTSDGENLTYAAKGDANPPPNSYFANVALFRWDTSSIPDNATIMSAVFKPYVWSRIDNDVVFSMVGDYYDFGGEPAVSGDWVLECSPSIFTPLDLTPLGGDVRYTIPLTDLSGINKSGYTGIRVSLDEQSGLPSATNTNQVQISAYEHTGVFGPPGTHAAQLVVNYVIGTPVEFTVASGDDDGHIWRGGASWPPTGAYTTDDESAYAAKGLIYSNCAFFRWDTSSIPDDATITDAAFEPLFYARNDNDTKYSLIADYYDFGGEPSSSDDWVLVSPGTSIIPPTRINDALFAVPNLTRISLPLTDLSGINKSGYTGIRLTLDNPSAPSVGDNAIRFHTRDEDPGTGAKLLVAYIEPAGFAGWVSTF